MQINRNPKTYQPIVYSSWVNLDNVLLPDGGTEAAVEVDSIIKALEPSNRPRKWFIFNAGGTNIRLFHTDSGSVRTPYVMAPGESTESDFDTGGLAVFAWSEGGTGIICPSYYLA